MTYVDFVGLDMPPPPPEKARFHIIPVPYEKTVSYGSGTAGGPSAILEASLQLELFDGIGIPAEEGIFTHPPIDCTGMSDVVLEQISQAVSTVVKAGKVPVMLGGEHTITAAAAKAVKETYDDFGIVQFDAHADLRDTYEGTPHSHACVMRRVVDMGIPIHQIGVRSMSIEEDTFRRENAIPHLDAADIAVKNLPKPILSPDFPANIYLTIDIDAFDPSLIPATGTPEPGGLFWYEMIEILSSVLTERHVVGIDVVELAPIAGMHASEFTAAKLMYTLFGLISRQETKVIPCLKNRE